MKMDIGTTFTSATTNHNANPNGTTPALMSSAGAALAAKTAPASALVVPGRGNAPPSNPLQDSMDRVFRS